MSGYSNKMEQEEKEFSFTDDQIVNLRQWVVLLNTEEARKWREQESAAFNSFNSLVDETNFKRGENLTAEQLDKIFTLARELVSNRMLGRNLYEINGIENFNQCLRDLLYDERALIERVHEFLNLRGVGLQMVSQFLCLMNPREYPLVTIPTLEVLALDATQLHSAYQKCLVENQVSSAKKYNDSAIEYLRQSTIFREIKTIINVDLYTEINNFLWLAYKQIGGEEERYSTSVSLERDLRDYLANNTHLIGKGLKLIQTEYPTAAGQIDILCKDSRGNYVAIETKKGRESDKVVGQILRYIGSLKSEGKKARGIIILHDRDERMDFAVAPISQLMKTKYYKVRFEISDSP